MSTLGQPAPAEEVACGFHFLLFLGQQVPPSVGGSSSNTDAWSPCFDQRATKGGLGVLRTGHPACGVQRAA